MGVLMYPVGASAQPWGDEKYLSLTSLNVAISESFGFLQPGNPSNGETFLSEYVNINRMTLMDLFVQNTQAVKELLNLFYGT